MTTESGLSLNVTPDHGHVGDRVVLSPSGPDADRAVGGAASLLQAERDGEWVDLFHLVSWGEGAPSSVPVDGPLRSPSDWSEGTRHRCRITRRTRPVSDAVASRWHGRESGRSHSRRS